MPRRGLPATLTLVHRQRHESVLSRLLRVLTIIDGLIFTLFDVEFRFRFPRAVREHGKRNGELDNRGRVAARRSDLRDQGRVASR